MKRKYLFNRKESRLLREEIVLGSIYYRDYENSFIDTHLCADIMESYEKWLNENGALWDEKSDDLFYFLNYCLSEYFMEEIQKERGFKL